MSAVPRWMWPLAYGGPSCSTNFGAPAALRADLPVEVHRLPAGERFRLGRLQVRLHRKIGARQVDGVFPLGHYDDRVEITPQPPLLNLTTTDCHHSTYSRTYNSGWPRRTAVAAATVHEAGARQRPARADPGGAHRAAGVGVVLVPRRLEGRGARPDRRLALGRAHELQGHDQHPARQGQGHHRAVRRLLERLHLDRPDHLHRDRHARRARSHAVHRVRADGELPLRPRRLRVRAHGHHLGAAGRRERSRSAARSGADRDARSAPIRTAIRRSAGCPTCRR